MLVGGEVLIMDTNYEKMYEDLKKEIGRLKDKFEELDAKDEKLNLNFESGLAMGAAMSLTLVQRFMYRQEEMNDTLTYMES